MNLWFRIRWPLVFVCLLASMIVADWYSKLPTEWAEIRELRAQWDPDDRELFLSLIVEKHENCGKIYVTKDLRQVDEQGGYVQPTARVAFSGNLDRKVQAMEAGSTAPLEDIARPENQSIQLSPGKYLLTLVMLCEQAAYERETEELKNGGDADAEGGGHLSLRPSPAAKSTLPARITIDVTETPK